MIVIGLMFIFTILFPWVAMAVTTTKDLVGTWETPDCSATQSQFTSASGAVTARSGYTKYIFKFETDGKFHYEQNWFSDETCSVPKYTAPDAKMDIVDDGMVILGGEFKNDFVPVGTVNADFYHKGDPQGEYDLGILFLNPTTGKLRISRGLSRGKREDVMRNTMLNFTEWVRK